MKNDYLNEEIFINCISRIIYCRYDWIRNKDFKSSDDNQFKVIKLSDFKAYEKSNYVFNNIKLKCRAR